MRGRLGLGMGVARLWGGHFLTPRKGSFTSRMDRLCDGGRKLPRGTGDLAWLPKGGRAAGWAREGAGPLQPCLRGSGSEEGPSSETPCLRSRQAPW